MVQFIKGKDSKTTCLKTKIFDDIYQNDNEVWNSFHFLENLHPYLEVIQREDKPIIFDLSSGRSKMELNDWFKNNAPSKICKSDGVGWIYILSENISEKEKRKLFESDGGIFSLRQEWAKINEDPNYEVTFDTFKDLAERHDCKHGKWTIHTSNVDELWQNLGLAFAYSKFPKG